MTMTSSIRKKEKTLIVWAFVGLLVVILVPLIYWDALGSGAMHFMRYGNVSVAGSSAGDSHATFFFGLDYTFSHMGPGVFIPSQLFSAQWRVVLNTTEALPFADFLGLISLILIICMIMSTIAMIFVYSLDRRVKRPMTLAIRTLSLGFAFLEAITVVWFAIIVFVMASKISAYDFRIYDFLAYGGAKTTLEVLVNLVLAALNLRLHKALKTEEDG